MTSNAELLAKRRDRAIAIILGVKEREVDQYLPPQVRAKLRKVILDQLNDLYQMALDVTATLEEGDVVVNELWLEKIDAIYSHVVERAS